MNAHQILDINLMYYGRDISELMYTAGKGCARHIKGKNIGIFCGLGNNGGDGFVAAQECAKKSHVTVYLLGAPEKIKTDAAREHWDRLITDHENNITIEFIKSTKKLHLLKRKMALHDTYVDAMLGVGLQSVPREPFASVIKCINRMKGRKLAIDIPSGYGTRVAFKPDRVLSLHVRKCPLPTTVVDIGITKDEETVIGPGHVQSLAIRHEDSHKGQNGKVLVIAGSKTYHGAAIYCSEAASLFADLVYVVTTKENVTLFKKSSPEFIVSHFEEHTFTKKFCTQFDVILVGPGIAESKQMRNICEVVLRSGVKCVYDATALSLVSPQKLHKKCIVTPHAGEFKKLFGIKPTKMAVQKMAKKHNCTIILKGKVDFVSSGKDLYHNHSGNAGMTTGGTGDILAGICAGMLTKNAPLQSAQAGVFLNGFAGDFYKGTIYNASKVLETLPMCFALLKKFPEWDQ